MAPLDKQYSNGLVGPFAVRTEKVGLAIFAGVLVVVLFVLFVRQPEDPRPLYIYLVFNVGIVVMSAVRLRNMRRRDREEVQDGAGTNEG